jgi:hypothetical protein
MSQEKTQMPEIIKNKTVVSDDWTVLRLAEGETAETVTCRKAA